MDIYYIDYISIFGKSWLHRLPAWVKLGALVVLLGVLLSFETLPVSAGVLAACWVLAAAARLPMKTYLALSAYPVFFLFILLFSIGELALASALVLIARVLATASLVNLLLLTTSYPAIFGALSRVLPAFLPTALFFTYRAIFVIADSVANMRTALHLRGRLDPRYPLASLRNLGRGLGHIIIHAIDTSQHMADGMVIRGFQNRIYYLGKQR